jgi:LAS superfamily LD-carboxypeptidase LdcB
MGRFDALTNLEEKPQPKPEPKKVSPTPPDQTNSEKTSLLANQQTSKPANQQNSLPINQQTSKLVNQQTSKVSLTTKEKKKYGTYLSEESITNIHIHAALAKKKITNFCRISSMDTLKTSNTSLLVK